MGRFWFWEPRKLINSILITGVEITYILINNIIRNAVWIITKIGWSIALKRRVNNVKYDEEESIVMNESRTALFQLDRSYILISR